MTTEHSPETKIAILEAKVEHMMGHVKELTLRVRANEKVVAIVSAVGIGAGGIIGSTAFAPDAEAQITDKAFNPSTIIQDFRTWESEKNRTPIEEELNRAMLEMEDYWNGSDDPTESEEVLQFPSDEDRQGS